MYYILTKDNQIEKIEDVLEWARKFDRANRIINLTTVGPFRISTVFLGMDYNFSGQGRPVLFETMIFSELEDQKEFKYYQERYCSIEEARQGHREAVKRVKKYVIYNILNIIKSYWSNRS